MTVEGNPALEQEIKQELEHSEALKHYAGHVKGMSKEELQDELKRLDDELRDEEDEMRQMMGQTGIHMYASQMEATREQFEREIARIKEKQRLVNEELKSR